MLTFMFTSLNWSIRSCSGTFQYRHLDIFSLHLIPFLDVSIYCQTFLLKCIILIILLLSSKLHSGFLMPISLKPPIPSENPNPWVFIFASHSSDSPCFLVSSHTASCHVCCSPCSMISKSDHSDPKGLRGSTFPPYPVFLSPWWGLETWHF